MPALHATQELLGGTVAHSRRLLQPKIDEARDEGGAKAGAGADAAADVAEEGPLTLTLSDSAGKKLYKRAGEVRQAREQRPLPSRAPKLGWPPS